MSTVSARETVRKDELEDDGGFVYYVDLPTLQEMASYRVCLSMWYGYISSPRCILTSNIFTENTLLYLGAKTTHRKDIDRLIEGLRAPRCIKEMLEEDVKKILDELANWTRHVGQDLFPNCIGEYSLSRIDSSWCVWMPNGEIDYRKSAQKMLNSGGLNDVQKFVVMSKYCMEEEIRTVPLESLPECFDKVTYRDDCVLFYWICYWRNELHKVPCSRYRSVDMSMVQQCYGDEGREALEYFWRRSLNHEMHLWADLVVSYCHDARTWSILERLLTSIDIDFSSSHYIPRTLIASSIYSKSSRYPLWLWTRFKHRITVEVFFELVSEMLRKSVHLEKKMGLLTHIWDTADDRRRNGAVLRLGHSIILYFRSARGRDPPCLTALQFLHKYFSLLSPDARAVWFDSYYELFLSSAQGVHFLDEILKLHFVDSSELCEFKKRIRLCHEITTLGEVSLFAGHFERINVAADWLVSHEGGTDAVRSFKIHILQFANRSSKEKGDEYTFLTDFKKWNKLCSFIDETYAGDTPPPAFSLCVKQDFVRSWMNDCRFDLRFRDAFDDVKRIVESVYSSEQLKSYKSDLLLQFGNELMRYEYWWHEEYCDERFFENFIGWCSDSDSVKISQFQSRVPHGALLSAVLDRLTQGNVYEFQRPALAGILLDRLQTYLIWYLGSEQSVNEYKLRRINDTTTDLTFLKIISEKNESCLMVILKWFFNGCETSINTFMLKNSTVLNM